jgi:hypothetical protein
MTGLEENTDYGWMHVHPENIGALTDAPIITKDEYLEDDGWANIVYFYGEYAIRCPVEELARGESVTFQYHNHATIEEES